MIILELWTTSPSYRGGAPHHSVILDPKFAYIRECQFAILLRLREELVHSYMCESWTKRHTVMWSRSYTRVKLFLAPE